jgi:hypothetical protein
MKTEKNRKKQQKTEKPKKHQRPENPRKNQPENSLKKEKKHQLGQGHAMRRACGDY